MKLIFEKVPISNTSFLLKDESLPFFDVPWHNHPEYEIALITEGRGKKIIGDSISNLAGGTLLLLGSHLPHLWHSDDRIDTGEIKAKHTIIQFPVDFFESAIKKAPEFLPIKNLLEESSRGLQIMGNAYEEISTIILEMKKMNNFERILALLNILNRMALADQKIILSGPTFSLKINSEDSERMNSVYKFIIGNFQKDIYLEDAAKVAHLTPSSFARYFKSRTKKTFSTVLNEIRIGHACKLILEKNSPISIIAEESGFQNISNFNRTFKSITGVNPLQYQKTYKKI